MESNLEKRYLDSLQSIVIELGAAAEGYPPATLGRAIYAQILHWLQVENPQISEQIHEAQVSPLTVSGLLGNRRRGPTQPGDYFAMRVGLLDGNLLPILLRGIECCEMEPVILGKFPFVLRRVYVLPNSHPLVSSSSYFLLSQAAAASDIQLQFMSPTSFKQAAGIQTFPLPELVFGSLLRKWNCFAPEELRFPEITWQGLVSAYELKTHALKLEGGAEIGAQGWARYRFKDTDQAKVAAVLANFAFFAGVGRKTTMGMGQVQLMLNSKIKRKKQKNDMPMPSGGER